MQNDWFFEVLDDLKDYAKTNGYSATVAELDMLACVAEAEMPAAPSGRTQERVLNDARVGSRHLH